MLIIFVLFIFLNQTCQSSQNENTKILFTPGLSIKYLTPGKHYQKALLKDEENNTFVVFKDIVEKEASSNIVSQILAYYAKSQLGFNLPRSHTFFGTKQDICTLHQYANQSTHYGIFGVCRGAIAGFQYLAEYNPDNIKFLIAEAAITDTKKFGNELLSDFGISQNFSELLFTLAWPAYPQNTTTQIDAIKKIKNKNLPILILHSKEDQIVHYTQALQLYTSCKEQNFTNVHIALLKSAHAHSIKDDSIAYLTAVHSFYKHYGFSYNQTYATKNIEAYQYDINQAQREIKLHSMLLKNKIRQKQICRDQIINAILHR